MTEREHQFDRREGDLNVRALATRLKSVEDLQEVHGLELKGNTTLTKQLHEAVFGRADELGLQDKLTEMYDMFEATRNGFRMIASVGNFGLRVIETAGKYARPLFWIGAVAAACLTWAKTGTWQMPEWWIAWATK